MQHSVTLRSMSTKRAGMVRLDEQIRAAVDEYAAARGISFNAAMNILVRIALQKESGKKEES